MFSSQTTPLIKRHGSPCVCPSPPYTRRRNLVQRHLQHSILFREVKRAYRCSTYWPWF